MFVASLYGGVGIALFAAIMGLALLSQAIRPSANGLFALLCISGAIYLFFTADWLSTTNYSNAAYAIKQQTSAAILSCAFFVWFIAFLSQQQKVVHWLVTHSIISVILLAGNHFIYEYGARYIEIVPTKAFVFPWGEKIGYFSGVPSDISLVLHTYFLLTFFWGIWCGSRIYKYFSRPVASLHFSYLLLMLAGAFWGVLVDRGIAPSGYLAGHSFVWLVIVGCLSVAREQRILMNSIRKKNIELKEEIRQRVAAENRVKKIAYFDEITGLLNKAGFFDQFPRFMKSLEGSTGQATLFLINLTGIDKLYSEYGAEFGNKVVREVARKLSKWAGEDALIARIGENQFSMLLSLSGDRINRLKQLSESNQWDYSRDILDSFSFLEKNNPIRTKMGVVVLQKGEANLHRVFHYAQRAVGESNTMPGNSIYLYSDSFHSKIERLSQIENDLSKAVKNDQLALYFQPKLNSLGDLVGAEALLRWKHPEFGYITPDVFIPLAEQSLQINMIGNWVLNKACKCLYEWKRNGVPFRGRLAVNVSPGQLHSDHILAKIDKLFHEYNLPASALEIEVTESSIIDDSYGEAARLESLRKKGITIAMDDFGTGYSSLSRLHDMPIDTLKIDKSFVDKIDGEDTASNEELIEGIIAIARAMNMKVVAEGVETQEQKNKLASMGCDQFQGYLFAKPLPENEFIEFVKSIDIERYMADGD